MGNRTNEALIELANTVANGQRGRFTCPECNGGSTHESSLAINKEGLAAHCRCWRANCSLGYRRVMTDGSIVVSTPTSQPPRVTRYEGETRYIYTDDEVNMEFYGDHWCPKLTLDGRVVLPILDRHGGQRGEVVRQCKPYDAWYPKALTYKDVDYDGMSWFYPQEAHALCLVEDQLSAMRLASRGVIGVALLGTIVTGAKVATLRQWQNDEGGLPVHLALDADAYLQSVRQARTLYNQLDIRVHRIFNDVKDMDDEELLNFIRVLGVYTNTR